MSGLHSYNKVRVIGKGSYGEVWLVKHKRDKKQYVLKKLELKNASKRERKAAEQEAKLLSKLKHPNIVSYKDSFQDDSGYLFIAMGYCEGGDLYGRLKEQKSKPLEERQVVEWFVQIAMALQYMHEHNILHRDLKTQNIFLTKSKIIKLGDLGIARVLDNSFDMATTLIGTPYYMSPELFSNKPYNHKSDVWALGCCVYEMATLKHAFNAKDMNSLVYKILRGKMPLMPKIYSHELVTLIKAMLNHNPERRPSVNRILRDPYIKKNIAIFLEGTKKSRSRPSSGAVSARSTASRRTPDTSQAHRRAGGKSRDVTDLQPAYQAPEPVLEPLQVGPDLEVIAEEEDQGSNSRLSGARKLSTDSSRPKLKYEGDRLKPSHSKGSPSPKRSDRARSPGSRSHSRSPARRENQINKKSSPHSSTSTNSSTSSSSHPHQQQQQKSFSSQATHNKGHYRSGSDPVFDSPSASPQMSRNRSSSDKTADSQERSLKKQRKKKRSVGSSSQQEPEPIAISVDSVLDSQGSRNHQQKEIDEHNAAFGIILDNNSKPMLRKISSEPVIQKSGRRGSGTDHRRGSDQLPAPSSSSSDPRPSTSSGSRRGDVTERDSAYSSSSASRDDDRPTTARERRRKNIEQETPRTSRSVDLDRNRKSVEQLGGGRKGVAYSEDYSGAQYKAGTRHKSSSGGAGDGQLPKSKSSSSVSASVSSSSGDEDDEEKLREKEKKRNDREMNNFISLLDTTLHLSELNVTPSDKPANDIKRDKTNDQQKQTESKRETAFIDFDEDANDPEMAKALLNGATFVKGPAPKGYREPVIRSEQHNNEATMEPGQVPVIEVEEDTLTEQNVDQLPSHQPEYSYTTGTGALHDVPAGRTMTTTGRLWERITMLRKDCIRGLGVEKLKRAYDILDNIENNEVEPLLIELLGKEQFEEFAGKIWQLKFCEEAAFGLV